VQQSSLIVLRALVLACRLVLVAFTVDLARLIAARLAVDDIAIS
jgi:hypothetical protein